MSKFRNFQFLLLAFLLNAYSSVAQDLNAPDLDKSLIAPSPEAAALGKFGIIPVSLATGMANVSIPIYELKSTKLSVPISINYNYNGYRPGEEASWVGLGWTLQAGGIITRVVKGKVDESTDYLYHWDQYANNLDMTTNMDYIANVDTRNVDTEPDIYIFNFNGHSGKFILVGNRAFLFPHQDLKILKIANGFTITTEDGVTYYFQDTETSTPNNSTTPGNYISPYTSAWYLTKIVSTDNTDEIDFQYQSGIGHRQVSANYQESYQQPRKSSCSGSNGGCDTWSVNIAVGEYIDSKRLTGITCKGGYVNFIPEATVRQDFSNPNEFALKEIDIFQPNNKMIKKYGLAHAYFQSVSQLKLTAINLTGYYVNSIMGAGGTDSVYIPGYYTFQYYNENGSFPKRTRGIDKWGYYNGKDGNGSLFDGSITPGYSPNCPIADRSVYPFYLMNGALSKMTYPTGGYTTFEYENNLVGTAGTHQQIQNTAVGGTLLGDSVTTTTTYYPFNINQRQQVQIKNGRAIIGNPNGGILNVVLIMQISKQDTTTFQYNVIYTCPRITKGGLQQSDTLTLDPGNYRLILNCENTSSSVFGEIDYYKLLNIPYVGDPGPGLRIKSVKSYDGINASLPPLTKNYTYPPATLLSANSYGYYSVLHHGPCTDPASYTVNIISSSYSSPLATLLGDQYYYPTVTEVNYDTSGAGKTVYQYSNDGSDLLGTWLSGQTEYAVLNNAYIPVRQKINTYTTSNLINFWGFTYNMTEVADGGYCGPSISTNILDTIARYKNYTIYPYALLSNYHYLTATDETSYDQTGANPMTVHTDYYYDNPQHVQPTRTIVNNSKGYPITTQTKYPLDYNYASCTSLYTVDTTFKSARDLAHYNYQINSKIRNDSALKYWNATIPNTSNNQLMAVLRNFSPKCEPTFQTAYSTAITNLNYGISSYYSCLLGSIGLPTTQDAIKLLQHHNVTSVPIEKIISINKSGQEYLYGANKTDYSFYYSFNIVDPATLYETGFLSTSTLKSAFMQSPDSFYQARVNFKYDSAENITEQSKVNNIKMSYIWDYNRLYPIAQVSNSDSASIAYTSFEADGKGNWSFPSGSVVTTAGGVTGAKSFSLAGQTISRSGLSTSKSYIISFWLKSGGSASVTGGLPPSLLFSKNGWQYYESTASSTSSVSITGSGNIDELRLFPSDAQMTTYTYDPLIGATNTCSPTNQISNFFYDPLGRLKYIKDSDGNIIKTVDYHFQIQ